jgi:nitrogen fixation protein FixH
MTNAAENSRSTRWIPYAFFGVFLCFLIADVFFVALAVRSDPGTDTANAFEKGIAHNALLKRAEAQKALGWKAGIELAEDGPAVILTLVDGEGRPVADADLAGRLARRTTDRSDRTLFFAPAGAGVYRAELTGIEDGLWELAVLATRGADSFQVVERVVLK